MKLKIIAIFYIFLSTLSYAENTKVLLETNHGDITIELNEENVCFQGKLLAVWRKV